MSIGFVLFFVGILFFALTSYGLTRMPDAYCRIHAVSLGDTLGLLSIVLGLLFLVDGVVNIVKLVLVLAIMWIVNPTISHYVSKVALLRGNWIVVEESKQDREAGGL